MPTMEMENRYKGDWIAMFKKVDKNGSGDLDLQEFHDALRFEAKISREVLPDEDVMDVFRVIDEDNGGTIEGPEFVSFLAGALRRWRGVGVRRGDAPHRRLIVCCFCCCWWWWRVVVTGHERPPQKKPRC